MCVYHHKNGERDLQTALSIQSETGIWGTTKPSGRKALQTADPNFPTNSPCTPHPQDNAASNPLKYWEGLLLTSAKPASQKRPPTQLTLSATPTPLQGPWPCCPRCLWAGMWRGMLSGQRTHWEQGWLSSPQFWEGDIITPSERWGKMRMIGLLPRATQQSSVSKCGPTTTCRLIP